MTEAGPEGARSSGVQAAGVQAADVQAAEVQPGGAQPDDVEPGGVEPDGFQPDGFQPEGVEPDGVEPDGFGPGGVQPAATRSARLGQRYAVPSGWQIATLVERRSESPSAETLVLDVPAWPGHVAGQHLDLRLTAPDGYTAERSYSLANGPALPGTGRVEVTVQRVRDGEVSPYLVDDFPLGSAIEVRGPIGGWFVWDPVHDAGTPVFLLAGGSGLVPVMSMVRARREAGDRTPFRLIYSVRTAEDRLYTDELDTLVSRGDGFEASTIFTRAASLTALRGPRRLTSSELAAWGWPPELEPQVYVCGPTGFVEAVALMLVAQGHDPARIRTERFGPAAG